MVVQTRVALRSPIGSEYRAEIERRLFFVSPDIVDFTIVEHGDRLHEIVLMSAGPIGDSDALRRKVADLVETDVAGRGLTPQRVIWRSAGERPANLPDVYDQLLAQGRVSEAGEGQVVLDRTMMALMDALDAAITDLVDARFGAVEYRYPTLLPTSVLEKVGYFNSFPQFLMFVTRLHSDTDVYRAVVARAKRGERMADALLGHCTDVDYCLPPTMCFHTFHQLAGRSLDAEGQRVITAKGKSFRFESRYARSLERLWDFTIREVVFLGDRQFVLRAREELMADVFQFVTEIGLTGWCEVGNDPFFCDDDTPDKVMSQRLLQLKYELRADVAQGRSSAIASFNYHDRFFSESMEISGADGEPVSTACAGFGLERLTYAFCCQHGTDPAGWPAAVRDRLPVARA
ncbi:hypothetical protein QQG74_20615 [Micromonospora sp. FIMYZ51]|uniref:hypothetical protein n=1 Tax=Micromonospora sp. FIMYZ51 TaxID=3051832 RepID=UPI00311F4C1C